MVSLGRTMGGILGQWTSLQLAIHTVAAYGVRWNISRDGDPILLEYSLLGEDSYIGRWVLELVKYKYTPKCNEGSTPKLMGNKEFVFPLTDPI